MKRFAVFDIDGTLVRWQLYHAMTDALAKEGHIDEPLYQTAKAARLVWKNRANADAFKTYEKTLIDAYESALERLSPSQAAKITDSVFKQYKNQVYTYSRDLISRLKSDGYTLLAISGSQSEIVAKIAKHYGFDDYVGTVYQHKSGKYTGAKTVGSADKAAVLKGMIEKHKLSLKDSYAIGDTASDISMLEMVENPIAFNPERNLFDRAEKQAWKVVIERKNVVYELERHDGKYQLVKTN